MKDGWKEIREQEIERTKPLLLDTEISDKESSREEQLKKLILDKKLSSDAFKVLCIILFKDKSLPAKVALEEIYPNSRDSLLTSLRELEENNYILRMSCHTPKSYGNLGIKWFYSGLAVENIKELADIWGQKYGIIATPAGRKGLPKKRGLKRPKLKEEIQRKSISMRLRFKIFKRDDFTCQYCGRKAPDVELQVDHIIPVSKGGTNDKNNLITSCQKCNIEKSNNELTDEQVLELQRRIIMNGRKV
jgi:hypothetical protein